MNIYTAISIHKAHIDYSRYMQCEKNNSNLKTFKKRNAKNGQCTLVNVHVSIPNTYSEKNHILNREKDTCLPLFV